MIGFRMLRWALLACAVAAAVAASSASAAGLSSQAFGINISHNDWPADLTGGWPGSSGIGVARRQVIADPSWLTTSPKWSTTDTLMTSLAEAGLRLAPSLGVPCPSSGCGASGDAWNETPAQAASDMAGYVTAFAKRYGPGGSFWTSNPGLAQLPVELYEIGDEPNIPIQWIEDDTHLHWADPDPTYSGEPDAADYAEVYEASELALHAVPGCSGCEAVVGGLADSGSLNVTLTQDEAILGAITGPVDAVGFHPYTWQTNNNFAGMESDVALLRQYMSANGMANAPIELNEFDGCSAVGQGCYQQNVVTSSGWGAFVSGYTTWALCTPGLNVGSVVPFIWGDTSDAPTNFQTLVTDPAGTLTAYGQDYLGTASTLTTSGCPPPPIPVTTPGTSTSPPVTIVALPDALLRILHVHVHGSYVTVEIQVTHGNHSVRVVAIKGRHRIRLHVIRRREGRTLITLTAKLFRGKWTIKVTCVPPPGYATPPARRRTVKITR